MRISVTKFGLPQVVVYPVLAFVAMVVLPRVAGAFWPQWVAFAIKVVLAAVLIWVLMFFRDPERRSPPDINLLLAPADGRITEIETVEETSFICGPALRIGIFMSIFNAHINRAPCNVKIEKITYKKGKFLNAMNPQSGRVNESNDLNLIRTDIPKDKLIVRQISGAIARRIVCESTEGQELSGGERFGMIKFGSRTELYLPISLYVLCDTYSEKEPVDSGVRRTEDTPYEIKCLVKVGGKVKAGLTPLVKYELRDSKNADIQN
jgi:phosphatidylserine decarboxylase